MKFTVNRAKWCRGGKKGKAKLLNGSRNMCFLGFVANQEGVPKTKLKGVDLPSSIPSSPRFCPVALEAQIRGAVIINDDKVITDREREKRLRSLFKSMGYQIVFKGRTNP